MKERIFMILIHFFIKLLIICNTQYVEGFGGNDTIKLYWSHRANNFGDVLPSRIIPKLFGRKVMWSSRDDCDLVSCGSIIESIPKQKKKNTVVWSSGFIEAGNYKIGKGFKVVGVRGKLSESRVRKDHNQSLVLGDLGLLSSFLLDFETVGKKFAVGVVPHYVELRNSLFKKPFFKSKKVRVISPLQDCEMVVKEIAESDVILSSSLHGLIVADSLNIPNCYLQVNNKNGEKKVGGMYKYYDYYSIFLIERLRVIDENFFDGNMEPESLKSRVLCECVLAKVEVEEIKKRLIDSFEEVERNLCDVNKK